MYLVVMYRIVTGESSKMVVTLSKKAEMMAEMMHNVVISGHVLPLAMR